MSGTEERLEMVAAGAASESSGKAGTAGAREGAAHKTSLLVGRPLS